MIHFLKYYIFCFHYDLSGILVHYCLFHVCQSISINQINFFLVRFIKTYKHILFTDMLSWCTTIQQKLVSSQIQNHVQFLVRTNKSTGESTVSLPASCWFCSSCADIFFLIHWTHFSLCCMGLTSVNCIIL